MIIRRAVRAEAAVLSNLAREAKALWGYTPATLEAWRADLTITPEEISTRQTYVAETGTELAGFYSLDTSSAVWELAHLWVSPAHMRRGIGRALLSHAAGIAAREGIAAMSIDSDPNAERFYLACGASRVGSLPAPIEGDPDRRRPQLLLPTKRPEDAG